MRCMYKLDFKTICPVDKEIIDYKCKIISNIMIPVEELLQDADLLKDTQIFQENATQRILGLLFKYDKFGSYKVITKGTHSNVKIKCVSQINNLG